MTEATKRRILMIRHEVFATFWRAFWAEQAVQSASTGKRSYYIVLKSEV